MGSENIPQQESDKEKGLSERLVRILECITKSDNERALELLAGVEDSDWKYERMAVIGQDYFERGDIERVKDVYKLMTEKDADEYHAAALLELIWSVEPGWMPED